MLLDDPLPERTGCRPTLVGHPSRSLFAVNGLANSYETNSVANFAVSSIGGSASGGNFSEVGQAQEPEAVLPRRVASQHGCATGAAAVPRGAEYSLRASP